MSVAQTLFESFNVWETMGRKRKTISRAPVNLGQNTFCISKEERVESNQLAIKWLRLLLSLLQGMISYQGTSALVFVLASWSFYSSSGQIRCETSQTEKMNFYFSLKFNWSQCLMAIVFEQHNFLQYSGVGSSISEKSKVDKSMFYACYC